MLLRFTLLPFLLLLGLNGLSARNLSPVAVCDVQVIVSADHNCVGTISAAGIDNGSYSPAGGLHLYLDRTEFTLGEHIVTLTAQNAFGRSSCWTRVIVEDKVPPLIACFNQVEVETLTPDDLGRVEADYDFVELISDNCGGFAFSISIPAGNNYGLRTYTVDAVDDAGNQASCWGTINIVPPVVPTGYCSSYGNAGYEFIESMNISTAHGSELDVVSGSNAGAAYFSGSPIDFVEGERVNFEYAPGFTGAVYGEYWRFYLDLNRDGDFDDAGELIHYDKQNRDEVRYGSIDLPETFSTYGPTRMRVVMAWSGYRGPCETGFWGEREDYLVNLWPNETGARAAMDNSTSKSRYLDARENAGYNVSHPVVDESWLPARAPLAPAVRVWPNPTIPGATLNLAFPGSPDVATATVRDALGKTVAEVVVPAGQGRLRLPLPAALAPGVYLVSGSNTDGAIRWTERILLR